MTHTLTITLADAADLAWAQATVTAAHYLHAPVDPRARPMLGDMLPCPAELDSIHVAVGNPVIVGDCLKFFASIAPPSNLYHLSGGHLGECVIFAQSASGYRSTLRRSIGVIVVRSAKPQMVGVDASGHIALMADEHAFDEWPIMDFVTKAVGADVLTILGEDTVTLAVLSTSPQPAFIVAALVYVFPKLIEQGALAGIKSTVTIDVLQWLTLHPSQGSAVTVCDRRLLPTATHAQSARVRILDLQVLGFVVTWEESSGVPLAVSLGKIGTILDRRSLTTAALALPVGVPQSVLSNPRGVFVKVCRERGGGDMIRHVIRSFQRLTKPWDVDASPGHLYLLQDYSTTFPKFHQLFVMSCLPMYTDRSGAPIPGPSGKYGWAWRLLAPQWGWQDLECIKPRTFRLL